ncbi:MAG: Ig-like domain-containing protein [Lachnospiraceae bacterium]|nr:Ig-like domain-containing protein [Lachnospiraceae bacterium]
MKAVKVMQRCVSAILAATLVFTTVQPMQAGAEETETAELISGETEDAEVFALGSDGIRHDGIDYLTADEFGSITQDVQSRYLDLCDSFAQGRESGIGPEKVEFTVISKKKIKVTEHYAPITYGDIYTFPGEGETYAADDPGVPGEQTEDTFDSLFVGDIKNRSFKSQMTPNQLKIFNAGYKAIVKKNENSFSYYGKTDTYDACRAVSALILTYPWKFEWLSHTDGMVRTYSCSAGNSDTNVNVTMYRSQWYKKKDEENAAAIIENCVAAAENYAAANYPDNPVYGMVKYMDDWLGDRADYDYSALYADWSQKSFYYAHNSYGVLLNGKGVCESYAKAMTRFLHQAGIPNAYAVGNAAEGGGHAWNLIYMPNGSWYVEDATYNDGGYGDYYLLCSNDGRRTDGIVFGSGYKKLDYPSPAYSGYSVSQNEYASDIGISQTQAILEKGKKKTLAIESGGGYYSNFRHSWTSSNEAVAAISAKGEITAMSPGKTVITLATAGQRRQCEVYVSATNKLVFEENGKKKLTKKVSVGDGYVTIPIDVVSAAGSPDVQTLVEAGKQITVKSGKKKVARLSDSSNAIQVKGNTIYVKLDVLKKGSSTITVKYGGKTAKCTLKVKK